MLCCGHGSVCAFSLTVYTYTAMGWDFLDILVYSLLCGGLGKTVQHAASLPSPLRCVTLWAVRLTLFTKRSTVARVWNDEFRLDSWLNRWYGSEPSPPSKCAFNLWYKMHTTGLCVREVFLFWQVVWTPFLSISIVHSCLNILCATLYDAYFLSLLCSVLGWCVLNECLDWCHLLGYDKVLRFRSFLRL